MFKMALERKMKLPEEKTDYKILVSARELFVKHGFSGTSMGKIAMKANVNHSLIFHHFGNKQKFIRHVFKLITLNYAIIIRNFKVFV